MTCDIKYWKMSDDDSDDIIDSKNKFKKPNALLNLQLFEANDMNYSNFNNISFDNLPNVDISHIEIPKISIEEFNFPSTQPIITELKSEFDITRLYHQILVS